MTGEHSVQPACSTPPGPLTWQVRASVPLRPQVKAWLPWPLLTAPVHGEGHAVQQARLLQRGAVTPGALSPGRETRRSGLLVRGDRGAGRCRGTASVAALSVQSPCSAPWAQHRGCRSRGGARDQLACLRGWDFTVSLRSLLGCHPLLTSR